MEHRRQTNGAASSNPSALPARRPEAVYAAPLARTAYGELVEQESDEGTGAGSLLEYTHMLARNKGRWVFT